MRRWLRRAVDDGRVDPTTDVVRLTRAYSIMLTRKQPPKALILTYEVLTIVAGS